MSTFTKARQFQTGDMIKARQLITGELQLTISEKDRDDLLYHVWDKHYNLLEEFDSALTDADRDLIKEWDDVAQFDMLDKGGWRRSFSTLADLESEILGDMLTDCSEFAMIAPVDIAALTDAPILGLVSDEQYNGDEIEREYERVWWYPDYAVRSFVEDLLQNCESIWPSA